MIVVRKYESRHFDLTDITAILTEFDKQIDELEAENEKLHEKVEELESELKELKERDEDE